MEYNYRDCNNELTVKLVGRLTLELPHLEVDLQEQLKIKRVIEEVLYDYQVTSKETALVTSDLEEKINYFLATKKLEGLSKEQVEIIKNDTGSCRAKAKNIIYQSVL